MSTYSLSGSGTQTLTATTTALHVTVTTPSVLQGVGRANPGTVYDTALIRFGDGTAWWEPIPIVGGPQWIGLPNGCDRIGYACLGGAVISVAEVIGGTSPFAGPAGAAGSSGSALISSQVLSGAAASVTFSSIPGTYTHLRLLIVARGDGSGSDNLCQLQFNGDTSALYDRELNQASGSALAAGEVVSGTNIFVGYLLGAGANSGRASILEILIPLYAGTNWAKALLSSATHSATTSAGDRRLTLIGGLWRSTAAVTSINLFPNTGNFATNSQFDLYGVL